MKNEVTKQIRVYGIVQGVGFRPTVSRHAATHQIRGSVSNKGPYVEIFAQGPEEAVDGFILDIENKPPKRAAILKMNIEPVEEAEDFMEFAIIESEKTKGEIFVSPDIAICDECKEEYYPTYEEASQILADEDEIQKLIKTPIYRAKGCNKCEFTGYKGRLGVYEIMQINKEIKRLIAMGAHDLEIEDAAVKNGMKTLHQSCMNHILAGLTTIDEFVRVLGVVNE